MNNNFSKHLLTTTKKFVYGDYRDIYRFMKRSKVLSKWFRNDTTNDFVFVMETENYIYFSDASTDFAYHNMDC